MKKEYLTEKEASISRKISEKMSSLPVFVSSYASYVDEKGYSFTTQYRKIKNLESFLERVYLELHPWRRVQLDILSKDDIAELSSEKFYSAREKYRFWDAKSVSGVHNKDIDLKELLLWMNKNGIINEETKWYRAMTED